MLQLTIEHDDMIPVCRIQKSDCDLETNERKIDMKNFFNKGLVVALVLVYCAMTTVSQAQDQIGRRVLDPEIGLEVVCLQDPGEEGWELARERAGHKMYLKELEDGTYRNRAVIFGQPCFYEYANEEKNLFSVGWSIMAPVRTIQHRGFEFTDIVDLGVIDALIDDCMKYDNSLDERIPPPYGAEPDWASLDIYCPSTVGHIINSYAMRTPVFIDGQYNRLVFAQGRIFFNEREISLW